MGHRNPRIINGGPYKLYPFVYWGSSHEKPFFWRPTHQNQILHQKKRLVPTKRQGVIFSEAMMLISTKLSHVT